MMFYGQSELLPILQKKSNAEMIESPTEVAKYESRRKAA
jgi:hypothetical protein